MLRNHPFPIHRLFVAPARLSDIFLYPPFIFFSLSVFYENTHAHIQFSIFFLLFCWVVRIMKLNNKFSFCIHSYSIFINVSTNLQNLWRTLSALNSIYYRNSLGMNSNIWNMMEKERTKRRKKLKKNKKKKI